MIFMKTFFKQLLFISEYLIKGIEDKIVAAYHQYQVDMSVLYGAKREDAEKQMRDVLEFEFALANVRSIKA